MKPTMSDLLNRAAASADREESETCIAAAVARASSCHEWRAVLRGIAEMPLASNERLTAVADRTLEAATTEREVWGFRDVADVRAKRLGDERGAREALEAAVTALRGATADDRAGELLEPEGSARGYEWVLLAQGFLETLRDDLGVRRCLEAGRDLARTLNDADDLTYVAKVWAMRLDRDEGVALLLEAEEMSADGSASPWTLANAWHSLGDSTAVHRVLDTALASATSSEAALHVASAWASHDEIDELRRALGRAEELAVSADDWLEIAELAFDSKLGEGPIRGAVERAEALAADDEAKARVSIAYRQWLKDVDAATRAGSRGVSPELLRERVRTLPNWETSAAGLFDWLRARATTDILTRMANADYGTGAEKHLAALQDICETGLLPRTLPREPHEVLALTRWSEGERVDHLARALSCTLLCLAPSGDDELVTNGPILAESSMALGAEATHLAERLFAWYAETEACVDVDDADEIGPEQPVALLLLFILRTSSAPDDVRLEALADALAQHPTYTLDTVATWIAGSMRAGLWTDLIDGILVPAKAKSPATARVLAALGR